MVIKEEGYKEWGKRKKDKRRCAEENDRPGEIEKVQMPTDSRNPVGVGIVGRPKNFHDDLRIVKVRALSFSFLINTRHDITFTHSTAHHCYYW
jgi:hypothetical protein